MAVKDVDLEVRRGTIHALIGPNGAGKTTCFNLLTKFLRPRAAASPSTAATSPRMAPADIARLGLVRSFQISAVFPHLTVLENVRIALQRQRGDSFDFWRSETVLTQPQRRARSALLDDVGLTRIRQHAGGRAPYGRKRALEIATTLALEPEMMLLDEPMAGMAQEDVERIAELIRRVVDEPHHPDGRAQPVGRRALSRPHHRAGARPGAGRRRLRHACRRTRA